MPRSNPMLAAGCAGCGGTGPGMKLCARCKLVTYCSKECQRSHWRAHKPTCTAHILYMDSMREIDPNAGSSSGRRVLDDWCRLNHNKLFFLHVFAFGFQNDVLTSLAIHVPLERALFNIDVKNAVDGWLDIWVVCLSTLEQGLSLVSNPGSALRGKHESDLRLTRIKLQKYIDELKALKTADQYLVGIDTVNSTFGFGDPKGHIPRSAARMNQVPIEFLGHGTGELGHTSGFRIDMRITTLMLEA